MSNYYCETCKALEMLLNGEPLCGQHVEQLRNELADEVEEKEKLEMYVKDLEERIRELEKQVDELKNHP